MSVDEGEVGEAGEEGIEYGAVTSCLTVTCLMDDGSHIGGHLSLVIPPGRLDSSLVLTSMRSMFGARSPIMVHIAGQLDLWNSRYLREPLMTGEGEAATLNTAAYTGQLAADDVTGEIRSQLGAAAITPTTETRNGSFTIKLPA